MGLSISDVNSAMQSVYRSAFEEAALSWESTTLYGTSYAPTYTTTANTYSSTMPAWMDAALKNESNKKTKEKTVKSEISAAAAKRREKRITNLLDKWSNTIEVSCGDSDIFRWTVTFKSNDKSYVYAALFSNGSFWVTGRTGALSADDLIELLVEHELDGRVSNFGWV